MNQSVDGSTVVRLVDIRTGRLLLTRRSNLFPLLLALRPGGLVDICEQDPVIGGHAIGVDVRTGRERWRRVWTCDNDWYPANIPVISSELPHDPVQLIDSDTGRLLAEGRQSELTPGEGVLRAFSYRFDGRIWLLTGNAANCVATTRAWGPSLLSPELPGQGLAVLNGTILLTRTGPASPYCRAVGVDAFSPRGTPLWSVQLDNLPVGYPPVFDQLRVGRATTMAVGSTSGLVTAYGL